MTAVALLPAGLGGPAGGQGRARAVGDAASSFGAALELAQRMTEGGEPTSPALAAGSDAAGAPADIVGHELPAEDTAAEMPAGVEASVPSAPAPRASSPELTQAAHGDRAYAAPAIAAAAPAPTPDTGATAEPASGTSPGTGVAAREGLAPAGKGARPPVRPGGESSTQPAVTPPAASVPPASPSDVDAAPVVQPSARVGAMPAVAARANTAAPALQPGSPSTAAASPPPREPDAAEPSPAPPAPAPAAAGAPATPQSVHAAAPADAPAPPPVHRAVAAQVSPVVVSIAQRSSGSHQFTMTVNPESLGPVTVRARISPQGEVRVELLGTTDAGREALRTIVADLRRDLAAVMPHASLSLAAGAGGGAEPQDRGLPPGAGEGGQPSAHRQQSRGHLADPGGADRDASAARSVRMTGPAAPGAGLDVFV